MEEMMIQQAIKNALLVVRTCGFTVPQDILNSVEDLDNPIYRVAVVGKYQVGKSTLINKLFLDGNSLLPNLAEGDDGTQCKTAVATDVEYGENSKLEVYNWSAAGGEELVMTKENPTAADVAAATVGETEEERSELAKKISRVRLITPNESLKGYVLLDTPGLNDLNQELLLNTTYRIIPSADVALLVVAPKMLDEIVDGLLRKTLIDQGISKLMVLISYNPEDVHLSKGKRQEVIELIKAQLAKIGRPDIDVTMYCFDPAVEGVVNDISELRLTLRTFLNEHALPGRLSRVAFAVREYLENVELEIAAKLKALGSTEAEKAALKTKVKTQIDEFKTACEKSFRQLQNKMEALKSDAIQDVGLRMHKVFSDFMEKLEHARDVSEIRKYFERAEVNLKNDIMVEVGAVGIAMKSEIRHLVDQYNDGLADALSTWNGFLCDDLGINRPFLAKVPPIVWDGLLVVMWNYLLPFGWLIAILSHIIGKKTFGLDPNTILKPIILSQARSKIEEAEELAREQISDQIRSNVDSAFFKIKESLEACNKAQVARMQKAICSDTGSSEKTVLEKNKEAVAEAIDSLK